MDELQIYKNAMAEDIYGISLDDAKAKGICLECKEPALPKCYSAAGRNEYRISGLCEKCFDALFEECEDA